jgi:hypothetical protein
VGLYVLCPSLHIATKTYSIFEALRLKRLKNTGSVIKHVGMKEFRQLLTLVRYRVSEGLNGVLNVLRKGEHPGKSGSVKTRRREQAELGY